jgi:hypothetical protein
MDATLQLARRITGRLLEENASFFRKYHYLNPLLVDDSDQTALSFMTIMYILCERESFLCSDVVCQKLLLKAFILFARVFAALSWCSTCDLFFEFA